MPSELNESLTNVRQLDLQAQNSLSETIQTFFENLRRRLVGPAFRAALKSACMRPMNFVGVPSLENTNFALNGDQTSFNNSSLNPNSGCHAQDMGSHRKNPAHTDGLSPLKSIDENSICLDHQSSDSSNDRTFDTINAQTEGASKFEEDTVSVHNAAAGFSSAILKSNSSLLQDMSLDAKTHSGMYDRITKSANSSSGHLFYDTTESNLTDRDKLSLTPRTGSIENQITDDITSPAWPGLTQSFSTVREKRRYPRRFDRIGLACDLAVDEFGKLDDSPNSSVNATLEHGFNDQVYEFSGNPKPENPTDPPDDDEDYKRYCICRDVSYGDMIACDAPDCPFEWFHYACVNLTVAPKGRWFCPTCAKSLNNKRNIKKSSSRK
ncbi:unnamed protein product [Schistosoma turkestanicum]|nr:unnamed protein product [Schistosoma turkestanicum]